MKHCHHSNSACTQDAVFNLGELLKLFIPEITKHYVVMGMRPQCYSGRFVLEICKYFGPT